MLPHDTHEHTRTQTRTHTLYIVKTSLVIMAKKGYAAVLNIIFRDLKMFDCAGPETDHSAGTGLFLHGHGRGFAQGQSRVNSGTT